MAVEWDKLEVKYCGAGWGDTGTYVAKLTPAGKQQVWQGTGGTEARATRRAYKAYRRCMKHQCKYHPATDE